jgi:hypothetical protein
VSKKLLTVLQVVSVAALLAAGATPAFARTYTWDAIAVDDTRGQRGGDAGYGVGQGDTVDDAINGAKRACSNAGNDNCKVMLVYMTCGAYASSRNKYGIAIAGTERAARASALQNCGSQGCELTVSDCVE